MKSVKTILLIDDEQDILELVADQIRFFGFELNILMANNVELAESLMPKCDMILTDVGMPNRDKLEKLLEKCSKPIAKMTGYDHIVGDIVIHKPYRSEEFKEVIVKLIDLDSERGIKVKAV